MKMLALILCAASLLTGCAHQEPHVPQPGVDVDTNPTSCDELKWKSIPHTVFYSCDPGPFSEKYRELLREAQKSGKVVTLIGSTKNAAGKITGRLVQTSDPPKPPKPPKPGSEPVYSLRLERHPLTVPAEPPPH